MRCRSRLHRPGGRSQQRDDHAADRRGREDLAPSDARPEQDHCGRDDGADRDDRSQPCVPTRSAREQRRRPERGDEDRGGADGAREERLAVLPHEMRPDADQRRDRRRERNRVVLVEDPLHQAEHNRGDDEPPAPHDDRGTGRVGAGRTARHPQAGDGEEQCRGHQPRDLTADHPVEHAREAGAAPHDWRRRCRSPHPSAGRSRCSRA